MPYVIAPDLELSEVREGATAIVDGLRGWVVLEPDEDTAMRYRELEARYRSLVRVFEVEKLGRAVTTDGVEVSVLCNVGGVEEVRAAPSYGCEGVGLFRVEFLYLARSTPPSEEEIKSVLAKSLELMEGRPLIIRAPDIGGDKDVRFLRLEEPNPFLGLRGARLLLKYRDELLVPFLRAVYTLPRQGVVKLMFPMISAVEEVEELTRIARSVEEELRSEGVETRGVELGIMVETPSAALMLRQIASMKLISFVSIGTNDLTQYTLAVDRGNPSVGYLYSDMHPAVLRLVKEVADIARSYGIEVDVCGELAGRELAVPILLGMGIRNLSVTPPNVGRVKYVVRRVSASEAREELVPRVLEARSAREVEEHARGFLKKVGVEILT